MFCAIAISGWVDARIRTRRNRSNPLLLVHWPGMFTNLRLCYIKQPLFVFVTQGSYCERPEEPAILIYRLLLRMSGTYVATMHLFGLWLRMIGMHRTQSDQARLDLLSLVIWLRALCSSITWNFRKAHHRIRERLDLPSISPALHNLWFLLAVNTLINSGCRQSRKPIRAK